MKNADKHMPFDVFASRCSSRAAYEHIFSRWGMLVLARLEQGPSRFNEMARSIDGISERMLSKTLKILEEEMVISRKDYGERPPRVEYSLTESGRRITIKLLGLIEQLYTELELRDSTGK